MPKRAKKTSSTQSDSEKAAVGLADSGESEAEADENKDDQENVYKVCAIYVGR